MTDLKHVSTDELRKEMLRRGASTTTKCPTCRQWPVHRYPHCGVMTLHCDGCNRPVETCTCPRSK